MGIDKRSRGRGALMVEGEGLKGKEVNEPCVKNSVQKETGLVSPPEVRQWRGLRPRGRRGSAGAGEVANCGA